jgi:hypothetical protein
MSDERGTYRLFAAVSAIGLIAAVLGLGVALGEVDLSASPATIVEACARFIVPSVTAASLVLTAGAVLAIARQLTTSPGEHAETSLPALIEELCLALRALLPVLAGAIAVTAIRRRHREPSVLPRH